MSIQPATDVSTSYSQPSDRRGGFFTAKRWGTPLLIMLALTGLLVFLTVRGEPDKIEAFALNWPYMLTKVDEHIRLSVAAALLRTSRGPGTPACRPGCPGRWRPGGGRS